MQSHERQRLRNTLVSLPLLLLLMLGEVVAMAHEPLTLILVMHGLNNRYPYVDQRNIEQEKKSIQCQISHKNKQKDNLKIKKMDYNTMNFDRKIYRHNKALQDCNVKPTIPNFVIQIQLITNVGCSTPKRQKQNLDFAF